MYTQLYVHVYIVKHLIKDSLELLASIAAAWNNGSSLNPVVPIAQTTYIACVFIMKIQSGQEINCEGYVYEYHVVSWLLDIIHYLHHDDVTIRLLMILATIAVGELK